MKLTLTKETLAELTADDMSAVVGGGDTDSCSCTIGLCFSADNIHIFTIPMPVIDLGCGPEA